MTNSSTKILHLKRSVKGTNKKDTSLLKDRRAFNRQQNSASSAGSKSDSKSGFKKSFRNKPSGRAAVTEGSASRAIAAQIVSAVEEGRSLNEVLPKLTASLDERDKALVQEIVYGTLRHRRLLSNTLSGLLEHSINQKFNTARTLLLCGLYQLVFTRMPAHAIVASTVGACGLCHCKNLAPTVNACLRRFLREGAHLAHSSDESIEQSFPEWLYKKIYEQYPDRYSEILKASNDHAPLWLRVENSKISTADYLKLLDKNQIEYETVPFLDCAIMLKKSLGVKDIPGFFEGLCSIQDISAQMAAPLIEAKDGMRVLDTCSAPGGKSAHILDLYPNISLISADIDANRLSLEKETLDRLKRSIELVECDFSKNTAGIEGEFDRILVDAPCSGTGVIRRHPDIKWLRRKNDIDALVTTQEAILDNAFSRLKKGGILVYTTCSILKEENISQVENFLKRHKDAELCPFMFHNKEVSSYQRIPGEYNGDGFFYARFLKV